MTETKSALARAFVLMAAMILFAVVWNADHRVQEQFVIARKADAERERQTLLAYEPGQRHAPAASTPVAAPASAVSVNDAPSTMPARGSFVARVEVDMLLPNGIARGRYQVVDQSGSVQTIRVTVADEPAEHHDVHVLDQPDGTHRYFIRLTDVADRESSQLIR